MDPNSLPQTSTERPLAVADIIEFRPERWEQAVWFRVPDGAVNPPPVVVAGAGHRCNTSACVAGWAVALSPTAASFGDWTRAGAMALGLDMRVAQRLFRQTLPLDGPELADVLRRLAKLTEGERYDPKIAQALTNDQYRAIMLTVDCRCLNCRGDG